MRTKHNNYFVLLQGGFARAYELTDLTTGQVYAGKIISKSTLTKPHQKEKVRPLSTHISEDHKKTLHKEWRLIVSTF